MALIRWASTAAPELRALAEGGAIAVWPIGSTEQHGEHLVTGFDLLSATAVCERAAAAAGAEVVLLPGLPFGASEHWLALGATASLRPETLVAVVADVVRSVAAAGFRRHIIVNGHAGNVGPVLTALGDATLAEARVELISYWTLVPSADVAAACRVDGGGIGHAGEVETSIALHLGGGCVHEDRIAAAEPHALGPQSPGSRTPWALRSPRPLAEAPAGVYGDPRPARSELGALIVERAVTTLAAHLDDEDGRADA